MSYYNVAITIAGVTAHAVARSDDLSVGKIYFAWRSEKSSQSMNPSSSAWIDAEGSGYREARHASDVTGDVGDSSTIVVNVVFNDTDGVAVGSASESIFYPGTG